MVAFKIIDTALSQAWNCNGIPLAAGSNPCVIRWTIRKRKE